MPNKYMRSVLNIFVDSPFVPLEEHAKKGIEASLKLNEMMDAYFAGRDEETESLWREIGKLEHEADIIKQQFRTELPGSYIIQIDKADLLKFITAQDLIANCAEDAADWLILRPGKDIPEEVKKGFFELMEKTVECIHAYEAAIHELDPIHATSYSKTEIAKFLCCVPPVEELEHEVDVFETQLRKIIFKHEKEIGGAGVYHLCELTKVISAVSDQTTESIDILIPMLLKFM